MWSQPHQLMSNFIAGGVLISMLSPFSFVQGVVFIAAGVLLYTLWSGFRASVLTDFVQVVAMLGAVVVIIPAAFFITGFPDAFETGASNLTEQQSNFFSSDAFLNQGAPYIAAVLAYAIGNQTIAQRLFAVREDLIKPTFITATVGYARRSSVSECSVYSRSTSGSTRWTGTSTTSSRKWSRHICRRSW